MMGAWVAGHNVPGSLPESEPGAFASWRDAAEYLRGEMIYHAQEDDERVYEVYGVGTEDEPIVPTAEAEVRAIWRDDPPREGEPWGVILSGNDERGPATDVSWWLVWSPWSRDWWRRAGCGAGR